MDCYIGCCLFLPELCSLHIMSAESKDMFDIVKFSEEDSYVEGKRFEELNNTCTKVSQKPRIKVVKDYSPSLLHFVNGFWA